MMLVRFAHQILDMTHSIESYLGMQPLDWENEKTEFVSVDAWNESTTLDADNPDIFDDLYDAIFGASDVYVQNMFRKVFAEPYDLETDWRDKLENPNTWYRIRNPDIKKLEITDDSWKVKKKLSPWNPKTSNSAYECDDTLWWISNQCGTKNHSIATKTTNPGELYIPLGLTVFKPLAPGLFEAACIELRHLYESEDIAPTLFFSPDRKRGMPLQRKTMLIYTIKRASEDKDYDYLYPQKLVKETIGALHNRGFVKLAEFAMLHVAALVQLTGADPNDMDHIGGIMFLRYAPYEGFRRHIDGTSGLGHSPGPILNITMGTEGEKVFDLMPSACWDGTSKVPIRVTTKPGEGILMWGESRTEWSHCIPEGDPTWRYTMAIKLKENTTTMRLTSKDAAVLGQLNYKQYDLDLKDVEDTLITDQSKDVPMSDTLKALKQISKNVQCDDSGEYRYRKPSASGGTGSSRRSGVSNPVNSGHRGNQTDGSNGRGQIPIDSGAPARGRGNGGGGVPTASGRSWPRRWDRAGVHDNDILLEGGEREDNITAVEQAISRRGRGRGK